MVSASAFWECRIDIILNVKISGISSYTDIIVRAGMYHKIGRQGLLVSQAITGIVQHWLYRMLQYDYCNLAVREYFGLTR